VAGGSGAPLAWEVVISGAQADVRVVGRYALYNAIAAGGMATVHLGRLLGPVGFSRTVAIKRLHAQFATDPEFVSMFLDEARLAARIRHPNVVPTLDVVATGGELFLVMEYVPGESVARLARALRERQHTIPLRILSAIMTGVLHGLHAAHEAKDERGHPLGIVHRDVSPQNILVGTDGVPRVLDFGVAKAAGRMQTTKEGQIKGKLAYMPPEQLRGATVNRQTDIYAVGVILWELVTGLRLFAGDNEGMVVAKVLEGKVEPPSRATMARATQTLDTRTTRQLDALDTTILRALAMNPEHRFGTAREMALELERHCPPATGSELADWLESVARDVLNSRAALVAEIESSASLHAGGRDGVMSVLRAKPISGTPSTSYAPSQGGPPTPLTLGQTVPLGRGYQPEGPPVTQPSSISVSKGSYGQPQPSPRPDGRTIVAAIVCVLLGVIILASALIYIRTTRSPGAMAAPSSSTAAAASPPKPAPEPTAEDVAPAASVAPLADTTEDAGTAAAAIATGTTKSTHVRRPTTPAPVKSSQAQSPKDGDCSMPYWYDAQNVKRYKPQCLGN
jgi:eukaryotic-like serine/threonine-protein kinase